MTEVKKKSERSDAALTPEWRIAYPFVHERRTKRADGAPIKSPSFDMTVLAAANGNDALSVSNDFGGDIDLLLTDIVMPRMDGVKLSEAFAAARPETSVVFMSGYAFPENRIEGKMPDDALFIAKPFQEEKIKQILERALQRRDERLKEEAEKP